MGEKLRLGWKKTSAPDGTLVNEKQQKVKNICKRTPATQCSIPNTKYHPEFHFHSHSTSSIMSSIRYEETEKRRKLTTACASLAMNVCECVCECGGCTDTLRVSQESCTLPPHTIFALQKVQPLDSFGQFATNNATFGAGQSIEFPILASFTFCLLSKHIHQMPWSREQ